MPGIRAAVPAPPSTVARRLDQRRTTCGCAFRDKVGGQRPSARVPAPALLRRLAAGEGLVKAVSAGCDHILALTGTIASSPGAWASPTRPFCAITNYRHLTWWPYDSGIQAYQRVDRPPRGRSVRIRRGTGQSAAVGERARNFRRENRRSMVRGDPGRARWLRLRWAQRIRRARSLRDNALGRSRLQPDAGDRRRARV